MEKIHFKSINNLYEYLGVPAPENPFLGLNQFNACSLALVNKQVSYGFYTICFKKIESGEIANDVKTVEKEIKKMEKMNHVKDESRKVVKIGTIASYIKHLNDVEGIRFNWRKYGST